MNLEPQPLSNCCAQDRRGAAGLRAAIVELGFNSMTHFVDSAYKVEPLEGTSRGGCCTPQGTLRGEAERRSVGDKAESQHACCFAHTAGGLQNAHITQSRVCCHCCLCAETNESSGSATARTSVLVAVKNSAHTRVFVALCRPALRNNAWTPDPVPLRQRSSKGVQPCLLQAVLPGAGRGPWSSWCCVLHSPQGLTCRVSCGSSWVLCTGCVGCK